MVKKKENGWLQRDLKKQLKKKVEKADGYGGISKKNGEKNNLKIIVEIGNDSHHKGLTFF